MSVPEVFVTILVRDFELMTFFGLVSNSVPCLTVIINLRDYSECVGWAEIW
jgi:hypothetical protein